MFDPASIYESESERTYEHCLYEIAALSKIGAAASDSALKIASLDDAQCHLFEIVHRLAHEAIEKVEAAEKRQKRIEQNPTG